MNLKHFYALGILLIILALTPRVQADIALETSPANEKSEKYTYCVDVKKNECLNACQYSEDINCAENCQKHAEKVCKSI